MRAAFLCQDLLPAFFGVARGGCSLSGWCLWCLRCLRCLPVFPAKFAAISPVSRIILFSSAVCYPPRPPFFRSPIGRPSPYCPGKIAPPRSETAPKTRPCVDFAPFCLLYSIIFCNMDLLSARVVTARTVPAMRNRMFSEESVLWPLGGGNCSLRRESFYRHTDRFGM